VSVRGRRFCVAACGVLAATALLGAATTMGGVTCAAGAPWIHPDASCARVVAPPSGADVGAAPVRASIPTGLDRTGDWRGGSYPTESGETVRVYVSDLYPVDDTRAVDWAEYLGSLLHGPELSDLTLYVAPQSMVTLMCGVEALGCYFADDESIVVVGDEVELPDPLTVEQVVAHEYGHHVAKHRANPPWLAIRRGTKRWASVVDVCALVRNGSIGDRYDRDPGEGFAETYRVLIDTIRGTPFTWPILDTVLAPNRKRLEHARLDVVVPWRPVNERFVAKLPAPGRTRRFTLATPWDGVLAVKLVVPRGARARLTVTDRASRRVVAQTSNRATTTVCGERRLDFVVRTIAGSGSFSLVVTKP
jgi:hypothetical protein